MFILFAFGGLGIASPIMKATGARDEPTAALVLVLVAETEGLLATGILVAAEYLEFGQNLFFRAGRERRGSWRPALPGTWDKSR